VKDYKPKHF